MNTITRIVVAVPPKAEFETGFVTWVLRVSNIAKRIGCRVIFFAHQDTIPLIRGAMHREKIEARTEFRNFDDWGDFALMVLMHYRLVSSLIACLSNQIESLIYKPQSYP